MMGIQNLVLFCQFVLKMLSKIGILTSIKGSNYLQICKKTKIYNTNIDLVNENVFTKCGLFLLGHPKPKKTLIFRFVGIYEYIILLMLILFLDMCQNS